MGGRGRAPKDPNRRVRRNADPVPLRTYAARRVDQPPLPDGVEWHPMTIRWWRDWAEMPQAEEFTALDWSFLLDTALLHTAYWAGNFKAAAEVRLRVAKYGATPEDRARLRIQFADADEKDDRPKQGSSYVTELRARRARLIDAPTGTHDVPHDDDSPTAT